MSVNDSLHQNRALLTPKTAPVHRRKGCGDRFEVSRCFMFIFNHKYCF